MPTHDGARISPTAHYTSYIWFKNGLSHPALSSPTGRAMYLALWPMNRAWEVVGGRASLEQYLLLRHRTIDEALERAITSGEVRQVIEIAAGFSPRGFRFAQRFAKDGLRYIEGDLPPVAAAKRERLDAAGLRGDNHQVVPLDALSDDGDDSLALVAATLEPSLGTAILTEGLIGYLDRGLGLSLFARIGRALDPFPQGMYLSDLYLAKSVAPSVRAFRLLLQAFVRGKTHTQADTEAHARALFGGAGFADVMLHDQGREGWVRIVEARTKLRRVH
jgi:O-methyltransferase involved in polyketide biosynthesis